MHVMTALYYIRGPRIAKNFQTFGNMRKRESSLFTQDQDAVQQTHQEVISLANQLGFRGVLLGVVAS